jgi:tRNA pseudouridine13 synthase
MADPKPTARIRTQPEDFEVEELPAYDPSGAGEHLYVTFRKRGLDTLEAVRRLASTLGVQARDAGTAGLKDRHAVTTQTVSFPFPLAREVPTLEALSADGLTALAAARHGNKLRTGHLRGNRFRLVLRGIDEAAAPALERAFLALAETGLPNHYGVQRFGREGDNARVALEWMRGEARPPRDQRIRRLQFSALQSLLFNRVLDARIADGTWDKAVAGDLVVRGYSGRVFPYVETDEAAGEVSAGELSATGPMFGARMTWPEGAPAELERRILVEGVGDLTLFDRHRNLGEGARRALRLVPSKMRVDSKQAEPGSMLVEFVLPKGAYATSVLEAVCVVEDATRAAPRGAGPQPDPEDVDQPETKGKQESQ